MKLHVPVLIAGSDNTNRSNALDTLPRCVCAPVLFQHPVVGSLSEICVLEQLRSERAAPFTPYASELFAGAIPLLEPCIPLFAECLLKGFGRPVVHSQKPAL